MTEIINHSAASRYEWIIDGQTAVADYRLQGDQLLITHVEVPHALRNRGLAAKLMDYIVADAQMRGIILVPICSYAIAYMQRNNKVS